MPPLFNRRPEFGLPAPLPPVPLPLAELLRRVGQTLAERFAESYWVVAEIAELTLPRFDGGHCYLVLTDQHTTGRGAQLKAQVRATLWSQRYQTLASDFAEHTGQELCAGLKVMLRVQVRFHEQYGLSLDVLALDPSYTVGELARQRLLTVRKLEAKGLLERQKLLPLPIGTQHLAVISSPTAAGFQDFVQQLRESVYDFTITLFPASMQGAEAPGSIREALDLIRPRRRQFDAVLVLRGGGGKTDLLAFDDYGLAAAIGSFPIPVLTGIGHERDEAVVDLTAHSSLKTPTAAAIFLIERLARLDAVFDGYAGRIRELASGHLQAAGAHLSRLGWYTHQAAQDRLGDARTQLHQRIRQAAAAPRAGLQQQQRLISRLQHALPRAAHRQLAGQQRRLRTFGQVLARRFRHLHRRRREQLLRLRYGLQLRAERRLHRAQLHLTGLTSPVALLPLPDAAELARFGYVRLQTGTDVSDPSATRPGDQVQVLLPGAVLDATITARAPGPDLLPDLTL
ncbi:exodeoxyribonuclease VII large subunit [Hymenobacter sp. BT175]|uniref:exodeoxyribonuclease VII large subunit n=1 Tax=Hymenobacter translucens TaxID=2886507 RepID=UPI001D0EEC7B|nr:exodeoxyribonuclease VII large subunit [Hymenobacter translucens]MCC2548174.1 exodeoxyribonuclease VII large subunit [Hymenobacter translucens]